MSEVAVPAELLLTAKPVAPASRNVQAYALPINGSKFNSADPIKFVIPARKNSFLVQSEGYFRVRLNFNTSAVNGVIANTGTYSTTTGAAGTAWANATFTGNTLATFASHAIIPDGHISALVNRLSVSCGSVLLENTEQYAQLHSMMLDVQTNRETKSFGTQNILGASTDRDVGLTDTNVTAYVAPVALQAGMQETYCFAPISGVIGTNAKKFIPMFALSEGLIVDMYLNNFAQSFKLLYNTAAALTANTADDPIWNFASATANYGATWSQSLLAGAISIDRIEYVASYLELSDDAMAQFKRLNPSPTYVIPTEMYRQYQSTIPANSTSIDVLVGARFGSIKSVFATLQPAAFLNSFQYAGVTGRTKANLQYASLRINGVPFPQRPLDFTGNNGASSQGLMEVEKAIRNTASVVGGISFSHKDWAVGHQSVGTVSGGTLAQNGAFLLAFNLDQMRWTSIHGGRAGVSTMDAPYYLSLQFDNSVIGAGTTSGNPELLNVTVFNYIDGEIVIDESSGSAVVLL